MSSSEEADSEEEKIRLIVRQLPDHTRAEYFRRYEPLLKDPDTYAVLSYVVLTGLRHVYLGDLRRAAMDIFGVAVGLGLLILGHWVGAIPLAIVFVLDLRDLFARNSW